MAIKLIKNGPNTYATSKQKTPWRQTHVKIRMYPLRQNPKIKLPKLRMRYKRGYRGNRRIAAILAHLRVFRWQSKLPNRSGMGDILLNKIGPQARYFVSNQPLPYNKVKLVTKAKVRGHIMATKSNITDAINDRLQKANDAWGLIRGSSSLT